MLKPDCNCAPLPEQITTTSVPLRLTVHLELELHPSPAAQDKSQARASKR
jgi:hypothetical protein